MCDVGAGRPPSREALRRGFARGHGRVRGPRPVADAAAGQRAHHRRQRRHAGRARPDRHRRRSHFATRAGRPGPCSLRRRDRRSRRPDRPARPHRSSFPHRGRSETRASSIEQRGHQFSRPGTVGRAIHRAAASGRGRPAARPSYFHCRPSHRRRTPCLSPRCRCRSRSRRGEATGGAEP